jgi:hypothetical protein
MMKRKPFRSQAYTKWVRSLPCCFCGMTPSDAHHVIGLGWGLSGMGMKAPCSFTMPLCRYHHGEVHKSPGLQAQQPQWLRWTLRKGIKEFGGEVREQLTHALAFVEAKEGEPA